MNSSSAHSDGLTIQLGIPNAVCYSTWNNNSNDNQCCTQKKVSVLIKTHKRRISATDNKHFYVSY